ncbi:MAG: hypothetical protein KGJ98_05715 [Chloroflexota bacterium]|nr:hypothetical protein [Chloroflexota bacterium]MDE3101717.1 hypothetical protein [Chloroflexota bacterium]
MGTHFHDQPPEHWAPPVSLDPTPVWKQYIVIGVLLVVALVVIAVVSVPAVMPTVAAPPAVVPGGRAVLPRDWIPPVAGYPHYVGAPLLDDAHALWLVQPTAGTVLAVRARWAPSAGAPECAVAAFPSGIADTSAPIDRRPFFRACPAQGWLFGPSGEPIHAPRSLARYLVSVTTDRVIVNISDEIPSSVWTPAPSASPRGTP